MLDVETRGSQSLLNVQAFSRSHRLQAQGQAPRLGRKPRGQRRSAGDLQLADRPDRPAHRRTADLSAPFERDSEKRLRLKGRLKQDALGPYWFRTVTGTTPDGRRTLIIWRKLTGEPEQDNLVLDEWFTKQGYSAKDSEFDLIYVNGGNNLENLKTADDDLEGAADRGGLPPADVRDMAEGSDADVLSRLSFSHIADDRPRKGFRTLAALAQEDAEPLQRA
jgi:adenine-specific DNA-methyltransferase